MNKLNPTLRAQAVNLGLCNQWQNDWKEDWTKERMAEQFFRGLDFCLKYHWPSNDFIKNNFELDFLREIGVFVDDVRSSINNLKCLILGKSEIKLRYNSDYIGDVYVRDESNVIITAKGRSFVMVHLFDNATITAGQFDKAGVVIIKHSPDVTIFANDGIKIKEEYDYLKD